MKAIYNIPYGVFVVTAKNEKYNGCVINTLLQLTSSPCQIAITLNKDNYTTQMIEATKVFNVSILDNTADFELIKRFGFASGKDTDKFNGFLDYALANNGVPYITKSTNSYISAKVKNVIDVGTHKTFIAEIEQDKVIANTESLLYSYYQSNIKPKPEARKQTIWVCKVCGFVYQGEVLPEDFICPICKHGAADFEKREGTQNSNDKKAAQESAKTTELATYVCPICGYSKQSDTEPVICPICGVEMKKV